MPYIIVNDRLTPPVYYSGQGFLTGDTVVNKQDAKRFLTLQSVTDGPLQKRPDLRALGWRVIPVEK